MKRPLALTIVLCLASATAALGGGCPTTIDAGTFADEAELRALTAKMAGYGLRSTGSKSNSQFIDFLKKELKKIDGMKVRTEKIKLRRWQPTPKAKGVPGRDLAAAGGLSLVGTDGTSQDVPVAGPVPYALPTSKKGAQGELVYLPAEVAITAENSAGKVVLRDFPDRSIPYIGFKEVLLGLYVTPDIEARTGNYERPYLAGLHEELLAAGTAGAAGVIFAFHVPTEQVSGYFDPHNGTHYAVPAVYVGGDQEARLKAAAGTGVSANLVVRAKADKGSTRNLIGTLAGQGPERIVLAVNNDGTTWVQDNGTAGVLALARYVASLPIECRPRTFEFVFGGAHLHISREGTTRYADQLDKDYDAGTVSFAFVIEHLGTREILPVPDGDGQRLAFSGAGDPFLWAAGNSQALRDAAIKATKDRQLTDTAVLKGAELPVEGRVPDICSFGGIGGPFHSRLIPTLAMISGPWSLWAPSFGESAIDFARMRQQLLAAGDAIVGLSALPSAEVAGDYPSLRAQRAAGAPTCSHELPPELAPGL